MRSCLIQLVILFAVAFCLLWFALPLGVGALVTGALNASGFSGADTKVDVSASPPPLLLTGHADKIHITSSQVSISDLHAAGVDVILRDVDMLGRKIGTVSGTLDNASGGNILCDPPANSDAYIIANLTNEGTITAASAQTPTPCIEPARSAPNTCSRGNTRSAFATPPGAERGTLSARGRLCHP